MYTPGMMKTRFSHRFARVGLLAVAGVLPLALTACSSPTSSPSATTSARSASKATTTTSAAATSTACIFGNWTVSPGQSLSGSSWTIHPDGTADVTYAGAYSGPATFHTTLPSNPTGSTGSYVATPVTQNVTANGQPVTLTAHSTTWTCNGNSLALVVSGSGTVQLTRNSS